MVADRAGLILIVHVAGCQTCRMPEEMLTAKRSAVAGKMQQGIVRILRRAWAWLLPIRAAMEAIGISRQSRSDHNRSSPQVMLRRRVLRPQAAGASDRAASLDGVGTTECKRPALRPADCADHESQLRPALRRVVRSIDWRQGVPASNRRRPVPSRLGSTFLRPSFRAASRPLALR